MMRYSGLRIGDTIMLKREQLTGNKLFLYTQKTGVPVYTVLPEFVVRVLDTTPRVTPTHFFWDNSRTLDGVVGSWQKRLRKLFQLSKVSDGHGHRFRDTFAAELLLAGIPIERVAILLGHHSVKVTERYYAAWTDARQRQIEMLADAPRVRDELETLGVSVGDRKRWCEGEGLPYLEGDPDIVAGRFFSILQGDWFLRSLLGVIAPPSAQEIENRAKATAEALLSLFPPR